MFKCFAKAVTLKIRLERTSKKNKVALICVACLFYDVEH